MRQALPVCPHFRRIVSRSKRRSGPSRTHAPQQIRVLCGEFNPHVDFAAERPKVDWFGQKASAPFSKALRFVSASP